MFQRINRKSGNHGMVIYFLLRNSSGYSHLLWPEFSPPTKAPMTRKIPYNVKQTKSLYLLNNVLDTIFFPGETRNMGLSFRELTH